MKKQNGITLLALIITIIIMLILAGVTINIVGGSDGIVAKAEKAVTENEEAAMQEDAELSIASIKMDYYENYAKNKHKTAKEFIIEQLTGVEYKTSRGATMMADSEGNVTYTYKGVETEVALIDDGSVNFGESSGAASNVGETYYGEASVVPTDAKYFTFTVNEDDMTAAITGVQEIYGVKSYYENDSTKESFNCAINDNGTYITDVVIPYEYIDENGDKYIVQEIAAGAFGPSDRAASYYEQEYMFTSFMLPNTISIIGDLAFAAEFKMEIINIPENVTSIGDYVFYNCISLSGVSMPNVTSIGTEVFAYCTSLSSVSVPNVTSIGTEAFAYCTSLSSVSMPNVTSIESQAFAMCTSLSSINISESVTSIGSLAFSGWTESQTINCEAESKPSGWDANWDRFSYYTPRKAQLNWGVSM